MPNEITILGLDALHKGAMFVSSIQMDKEAENQYPPTYTVRISLTPLTADQNGNKPCILLRFEGARDIHIDTSAAVSAASICITDVSCRQWEGIRYSAEEEALDLFSLYCKRYEIVELPHHSMDVEDMGEIV